MMRKKDAESAEEVDTDSRDAAEAGGNRNETEEKERNLMATMQCVGHCEITE